MILKGRSLVDTWLRVVLHTEVEGLTKHEIRTLSPGNKTYATNYCLDRSKGEGQETKYALRVAAADN